MMKHKGRQKKNIEILDIVQNSDDLPSPQGGMYAKCVYAQNWFWPLHLPLLMLEDFEGQVWRRKKNKTKSISNTERKLVEKLVLTLKFTELDSSRGKKTTVLRPQFFSLWNYGIKKMEFDTTDQV